MNKKNNKKGGKPITDNSLAHCLPDTDYIIPKRHRIKNSQSRTILYIRSLSVNVTPIGVKKNIYIKKKKRRRRRRRRRRSYKEVTRKKQTATDLLVLTRLFRYLT